MTKIVLKINSNGSNPSVLAENHFGGIFPASRILLVLETLAS